MNLIGEFNKCFPISGFNVFSGDLGDEFQSIINDFKCITPSTSDLSLLPGLLEKCGRIELRVMEQMEKGMLSKVPTDLRQAFAAACMIKAYLTLLRNGIWQEQTENALKLLDQAYLIGEVLPRWNLPHAIDLVRREIDWTVRYAHDKRTLLNCDGVHDEIDSDSDNEEERRNSIYNFAEEHEISEDIPIAEKPSLEMFNECYMYESEPVKLTGCMKKWPALIKWKYMAYLSRIAGMRTVPVEMGNYSRGGGTRLMTLSMFLEDIKAGQSAKQCGYLAQHQLFDQEPELLNDFEIPVYCRGEEGEEAPTINAWIGPARTYTPLHYDPFPGMLCQVMGRKIVTLFAPTDTPYLYRNKDRPNTSQVDVRRVKWSKYPDYEFATPLLCKLSPGDMLFIPQGWWHAVEALDASISVNFFF